MDTAIGKNADEIQRLQAQIRKCLAKGYRTQAKPLIRRLSSIRNGRGYDGKGGRNRNA